MEITVTKPIEDFIEQQLARGYTDASEVARQAFLRWMEADEISQEPPHLKKKIEEARQCKFRNYDAGTYNALLTSTNESSH